ncbi:MAG: hypothetical protein NZ602_14535 [Thermoguttaceae bacterium]|nr:hypothetical protein [Thermoguttaceae bacterium]MDW8038350.1 hypothetical protein [Thermoguttaceae bacterium]
MRKRCWPMGLGLLGLGLVLGVLIGCGGKGQEPAVRAKGRILMNGKPLAVSPQNREVGIGYVRVEFYRLGPDGKPQDPPEGMVVNEDGSFELMGRGIPPGKYRIAVYQYDPDDKLGGRFDKDRSPIVREVTGKEDLVIDLAKP